MAEAMIPSCRICDYETQSGRADQDEINDITESADKQQIIEEKLADITEGSSDVGRYAEMQLGTVLNIRTQVQLKLK